MFDVKGIARRYSTRTTDERIVVAVARRRRFANVDCQQRRTLIWDSFGAFHRNTFVWSSLCSLRGMSRNPRQFALKAVSNFTFSSSTMYPIRSRPYPKSVSFRRIENAAQRRSDLHRLLGKSWSRLFFLWEHATLFRSRQLYWGNQNITSGCDICDFENDTDCLRYTYVLYWSTDKSVV